MFAKHQYKKDKALVIATSIKKCHIFNEAEVTLYPTLVKTVVKRERTASDIGKRVVLVNIERGLSPFAMVYLTEENVALMKQYHEYLLNESLVSTLEVKATHTKIIEYTHTDSEGFIMMLQKFSNLLFALFYLPAHFTSKSMQLSRR